MWLNSIKIAIVEKDIDMLDKLLDEVPKFNSLKEMEEAKYLLRDALELMYTLQNVALVSMKKIKKNIDYMNSTHSPSNTKLDIKS